MVAAEGCVFVALDQLKQKFSLGLQWLGGRAFEALPELTAVE
jgi:hypothetical protein